MPNAIASVRSAVRNHCLGYSQAAIPTPMTTAMIQENTESYDAGQGGEGDQERSLPYPTAPESFASSVSRMASNCACSAAAMGRPVSRLSAVRGSRCRPSIKISK